MSVDEWRNAAWLVANRLRGLLESGRLSEELLSERRLSVELSAGRGAVRGALRILEKDGMVSPPGLNKRRRLLDSPRQDLPSVQENKVCFLSAVPIPDLPQSIWTELYELGRALQVEGMVLELVDASWAASPHAEERLDKLISATSCRCWILFRTTAAVQLCFRRRGVLALVRGVSHPSAGLPYIDVHWETMLRHAAGYFYQRGHRSVSLCLTGRELEGNVLMEKGFLSFPGAGWSPVSIIMPRDRNRIPDVLARSFEAHPGMTALITTRGSMLIAVQSWLAAAKRHIPDDVSLLSAVYEPLVSAVNPPVHCYRLAAAKTTRRLRRMILSLVGYRRVANRLLLPEMQAGQSIRIIEE